MEIFSEDPERQIATGQFLFPVGVVLNQIAVERLVLAAVHRQVRLFVAIQVECSQRHTSAHRLLEDRCRDRLPMPVDLPRQSAVY